MNEPLFDIEVHYYKGKQREIVFEEKITQHLFDKHYKEMTIKGWTGQIISAVKVK